MIGSWESTTNRSKVKNRVLTDTHCHLDMDSFENDREQVLDRARSAGVERMLVPGLTVESSRLILEMAERDASLFAAVGIHPTEAAHVDDNAWQELRRLASHHRVRAVGEIGLDYYWQTAAHDIQLAVLNKQLEMAAELKLPVVIHCREKGGSSSGACFADLLRTLETWLAGCRSKDLADSHPPGVLHAFSGTEEAARQAIAMGFYIGVGGAVTYSQVRQAVTRALPLENLLLETDSPFMAPTPKQGSRNEPANVSLIADKIALLHGTTPEEVSAVTSRNANRLFHWDD